MELNLEGGEPITLATATALTTNFRKEYPTAIKAYLFSAENIQSILSQTGCAGLRIYNGYNEAGKITPVLVGTDADGKDLCNGIIMDRGNPCPSCCDTSSNLCK